MANLNLLSFDCHNTPEVPKFHFPNLSDIRIRDGLAAFDLAIIHQFLYSTRKLKSVAIDINKPANFEGNAIAVYQSVPLFRRMMASPVGIDEPAGSFIAEAINSPLRLQPSLRRLHSRNAIVLRGNDFLSSILSRNLNEELEISQIDLWAEVQLEPLPEVFSLKKLTLTISYKSLTGFKDLVRCIAPGKLEEFHLFVILDPRDLMSRAKDIANLGFDKIPTIISGLHQQRNLRHLSLVEYKSDLTAHRWTMTYCTESTYRAIEDLLAVCTRIKEVKMAWPINFRMKQEENPNAQDIIKVTMPL